MYLECNRDFRSPPIFNVIFLFRNIVKTEFLRFPIKLWYFFKWFDAWRLNQIRWYGNWISWSEMSETSKDFSIRCKSSDPEDYIRTGCLATTRWRLSHSNRKTSADLFLTRKSVNDSSGFVSKRTGYLKKRSEFSEADKWEKTLKKNSKSWMKKFYPLVRKNQSLDFQRLDWR